jgi:hypothetical protein
VVLLHKPQFSSKAWEDFIVIALGSNVLFEWYLPMMLRQNPTWIFLFYFAITSIEERTPNTVNVFGLSWKTMDSCFPIFKE